MTDQYIQFKKDIKMAKHKYVWIMKVYTDIFLLDCAFFAVVRIWHAWSSTDHTASLVRPIVALVTNPH